MSKIFKLKENEQNFARKRVKSKYICDKNDLDAMLKGTMPPYSPSPDHYICHTNGTCDNLSRHQAGGSAYIILNDNAQVLSAHSRGFIHTTSNRMALLAIISAVNNCPPNAIVDVYTNSQYSIRVLCKTVKPDKNPDLYELYKKCAQRVSSVRFHWAKAHSNIDSERASNLAYDAYFAICDEYNIEKMSQR